MDNIYKRSVPEASYPAESENTMKFQTTRKAITARFSKIISVPYCDLQHLLAREEAIAYTHGVYGWNANIYVFDNVAIVTGYRPFGNIDPDYQITRLFDNQAREIVNDWNFEGDKHRVLRDLILDYIAAITA